MPSLFYNSVKEFSEKTSLVFAGEENYTYSQLGNDVELLAEMMLELGVRKGDKVAILSTNMPNWGKTFFAISLVGAVAVPILPDFHSREIHTIIEHSESKVLFVSEGLYSTVSDETAELLQKMVMIDNFAIPAATIRGLFDYDYRCDRNGRTGSRRRSRFAPGKSGRRS